MQKITTHLWYDKEAKAAATLYTTVFPNSSITNVRTIRDTPSGDCDIVSFQLAGLPFMAISAGPLFKFTPAVSFLVECETKEEVDRIWSQLSPGGKVHMPLGAYPFSEHYGWTEDQFGLSWQIMYTGNKPAQMISPVLMFVGDVCGKAEAALQFYTTTFKDGKIHDLMRYGSSSAPDREGTIQFGRFNLNGTNFGAMDNAHAHSFKFNEAISFLVNCETQEEIDYFWKLLSAVPQSEQCGWCKDPYGLSWQIVPTLMGKMMAEGSPEQMARVTQAFLKMKKFDIAELEKAYEG